MVRTSGDQAAWERDRASTDAGWNDFDGPVFAEIQASAQDAAWTALSDALRRLTDETHAQVIEALMESPSFNHLTVVDPTATARAMATSLRGAPDGWARILGPCYTLRGLADRLGVTRAAVSKRAVKLQLLRILDDGGHSLFPAFALTDELEPVRGLSQTLRQLKESGYSDEPSTWAWWLRTSHPDLDDRAPIDALRDGAPLEDVLAAADLDAAAAGAA